MSRFRSMFSRMRVELISSRWVGRESSMTLPVMQERFPISEEVSPSSPLARRKTIWFIRWIEKSDGSAW